MADSAGFNGLPFSAEQVRWLAAQQLLGRVLQADVLASALETVVLSDDDQSQALGLFAQEQELESAEELEQFCRRQLLSPEDLQRIAARPLRLRRFCEREFQHKAEARFLERKTALDRVVYSLLRLEDPGLARELYLRIAGGEADFAELAAAYSQGPERQTRGVVGPVPLLQAHPALAQRLRSAEIGHLMEPFQVEQWWLVVRVENFTPASFDREIQDTMVRELFEEWLQQEVAQRMASLVAALDSEAPSPALS